MRMLLHVCCGPCATATLDRWSEAGADVAAFFHNPNIHPLMEFRRRLTGARDLAEHRGLTLIEDLSYDPVAWFASVVGKGGEERCARCIGGRLASTADRARDLGLGSFSTTLAISPWQDHEAIRAGGEAAQEASGVEFVYEDLRRLYPDSRRAARELGLYRQKYCGCVISEWERFREE
jgi:predicted adenine nucleotide alpha hydrolase (AANH) superfamily ATPase